MQKGSNGDMARRAKHLLDETPPANEAIERQLLGSLMLDDSGIDVLNLRSGDFYSERHQLLFAELLAIHDQGQPFDMQLFVNRLKSKTVQGKNALEGIGGFAYLEKRLRVSRIRHMLRTMLN